MARSSGGTFTLVAGNPVVSGTVVSSTTHNNTLSDIATELTDSLSRSGKGGMSAPLELPDGSVAAPAVTFTSDDDCGLYRIGANNLGVAVNGAKVVDVATTGVGVVGVATVGNGTVGAPAIAFTSDTDTGIYRIGANNLGVAVNGAKVVDVGTAGAAVTGTLASTGVTSASSFLTAGTLELSGANPTSTTAFTDTLSPGNIAKSWGLLSIVGGGGVGNFTVSVAGGFNITSAVRTNASTITVTFASAFTTSNYCWNANAAVFGVSLTSSGLVGTFLMPFASKTTTTLVLRLMQATDDFVDFDAMPDGTGSASIDLCFSVFGLQ
jgi:hypothetical protein